MRLYTSNRLENLLTALADLCAQQTLSPLTPEILVVQSQGMARWLSLKLAAALGVWANAQYPFPRAMSWQAFRACLPDLPESSRYEPDVLHWTLLRLLPAYLEHPAFQDLRQYFTQDESGLKHTQLAQRIARSFDQYVVYRPDWIAAWEAGEGEHWQAILWRAMRDYYAPQEPQPSHRAAARQAFLQALRSSAEFPHLPQRLHIFGVSALPPFYLDVFAALSARCEVHLWLLNPCQEYWGDIVSDTDIANLNLRQERQRGQALSAEAQYFTTGNSLLASTGKMGRDFIDLLNDYAPVETELFSDPGADMLLHAVQQDILFLQESGQKPVPPHRISHTDRSLQIHNCHSPLREIEVLHDQLLALMAADLELQPGDVLVMMPDIEAYAPLIEAVFATTPDAQRRIPFSIADRSLLTESRIIDSFLALLTLPQSRLSLPQVMSLLEVEAVQKRFDFSQADLDKVQFWLEQACVRWGIDEHSRSDLGLPAFRENTWRFGLERLLLGYALPNQDRLYADILPLDAVEGQDSKILSQLIEFTEALFQAVKSLQAARSAAEWTTSLHCLLQQFFIQDLESQNELQRIREALNQLLANTQAAGFSAALSPAVVQDWLRQALAHSEHPTGFMNGKVTFCAILPMRSIPFKIIALLGMNDRDYPRSHPVPGFDLMATQPRRGDRSRRHDDRYLFLETLLSARDTLYISYQGQSIQDNSEQPPSVLVSELLAYVQQGCKTDQGTDILPQVCTQHPLQAFSPRYFNGESAKLFSYAREYTAASQQLSSLRTPLAPFISTPLSAPEASWQRLDGLQLVRFFRNPSQYVLQQRLHLYPALPAHVLPEQEPLDLVGLEKYQLDTYLLERSLDGVALASLYPVIKASGQLPPEPLGRIHYQNLCSSLDSLTEQVRDLTRDEPLAPLEIEVPLGTALISATFSKLYPAGAVFYRPAKIKAKDLLNAWIQHLLLNAAAPPNYPRHSYVLGFEQSWQFAPLNNPRLLLRSLVALYLQGLSVPLSFFPETSLAYAEKLAQGKGAEAALKAASNAWQGSDWAPGEAEEPHYRLCFRQGLSLDASFQKIAKTVFLPLLKARQVLDCA